MYVRLEFDDDDDDDTIELLSNVSIHNLFAIESSLQLELVFRMLALGDKMEKGVPKCSSVIGSFLSSIQLLFFQA